MSHHFTADFTVLPPGKEPVSKKLQRENEKSLSAKRRETDQLDIDNKQMAWRLNQIKQAMTKEKEDRGKQGFIWKSGKSGNLDSYARNILGRSLSATTNSNVARPKKSPSGAKSAPKSKPKVRVLKDEPLDLPQRDSASKDLIRKLKSNEPPSPQNQTERNSGDSVNVPTREDWISVAVDRSSTEIMELQSDTSGNLPLSSIQAMDPTAVGVYFVKWGRKRLMMAVDNVIRRPKTGWGSEVYYPYAGRFLPEMSLKPEPPLRNISNKTPSPRAPPTENAGGVLLQGNFNEEENAMLFQQAINEWRQGKKESRVSNSRSATQPFSREEKTVPEMSVHAVQCETPAFEVKFSETSTLSYMEHILLDKHRKSEIPSMPGTFVEKLNDYLDPGEEEEVEETVFTAEELEERERIRELFSPRLLSHHEIHSNGIQEATESPSTLIIEEVSEEELESSSTHYTVEESPPLSPTRVQKSESSVVIEEVQYNASGSSEDVETLHGLETSSQNNKSNQKSPASEKSMNPENHILSENKSISSVEIQKHTHQTQATGLLQDNLHGSSKRNNIATSQKQKKTPRKPRGSQSARNSKRPASRSTEVETRRPKTSLAGSMNKPKGGAFTHSPSPLVKEIGQLPLNPDAIYHRGLDEFFAGDGISTSVRESPIQEANYAPVTFSSIASDSTSWNPIMSIYSPDMAAMRDGRSNSDSCSSHASEIDSKARDSMHTLVVEDSDLNLNHESDEQDEKALDDLEWELASRTGNITTDGRISRLIDEWSEDGDLDIIDDPGLGSGLSTPEVDRNSFSAVIPTQSTERQMNLDFQNMERLIMADLADDYSEGEDEL